MSRLFKVLSLVGLLQLSLFAVGNIGHASVAQYTVNIKKLELFNSTTGQYVVLSSTSTFVDIASGAAGASIGAMISDDAALTFGTYTKVRATIGNTFTVAACTTAPNSCTDNGITIGAPIVINSGVYNNGTHDVIISLTGTGAAEPIQMTIDFTDNSITLPTGVTTEGTDVLMETTLGTPFVIDEGSTAPSISVDFNVDNVLTATSLGFDIDGGGDDNHIIIDFPTVTISIN